MILYLFGGYSRNTEKKHWKLINSYLNKLKPKQILFIGRAELKRSSLENFYRFKSKLRNEYKVEVLNAEDAILLTRIKDPLVFIGGGDGHIELYNFITKNKTIVRSILNCTNYFGDSAGSMIVGSNLRKYDDGSKPMIGLNILKKSIIEPHYTQWNRHQQLQIEMKRWNCNIGIGIDEVSGIKIHTDLFPKKYEILGGNKVEVIKNYDI